MHQLFWRTNAIFASEFRLRLCRVKKTSHRIWFPNAVWEPGPHDAGSGCQAKFGNLALDFRQFQRIYLISVEGNPLLIPARYSEFAFSLPASPKQSLQTCRRKILLQGNFENQSSRCARSCVE